MALPLGVDIAHDQLFVRDGVFWVAFDPDLAVVCDELLNWRAQHLTGGFFELTQAVFCGPNGGVATHHRKAAGDRLPVVGCKISVAFPGHTDLLIGNTQGVSRDLASAV